MKIYLLEQECDDDWYGFNCISVFKNEQDAYIEMYKLEKKHGYRMFRVREEELIE
jgi:hypothetical protein